MLPVVDDEPVNFQSILCTAFASEVEFGLGSSALCYKNLEEQDFTVALFLDVFQHNEVHVNELINIHLIVSDQGFVVAINNIQITDIGCKGNLLLNRMVGSHVIVVPPLQYKSGLKQMMEKLAEQL